MHTARARSRAHSICTARYTGTHMHTACARHAHCAASRVALRPITRRPAPYDAQAWYDKERVIPPGGEPTNGEEAALSRVGKSLYAAARMPPACCRPYSARMPPACLHSAAPQPSAPPPRRPAVPPRCTAPRTALRIAATTPVPSPYRAAYCPSGTSPFKQCLLTYVLTYLGTSPSSSTIRRSSGTSDAAGLTRGRPPPQKPSGFARGCPPGRRPR